jgi:hypothetical protein
MNRKIDEIEILMARLRDIPTIAKSTANFAILRWNSEDTAPSSRS